MRSFTELHQAGTFLLVNVHDAGSAAIAEAAGAEALGTTSGGHAYTIARRDAVGAITRDEAVQRAAEICAAVEIPVSVDAENGWAHAPDDVAETIRMLAQAGAAGASIEDWSGDPTIGFYDTSLAAERIAAAVEAARALPSPFVICARADAIAHNGPDAFDDTLERLQRYAAAGADCLYAPGPRDIDSIKRLVDEAGGPVNALLAIGGDLTVGDMASIGVRRVSLGSSLYQATMAAFDAIVRQALTTGTLAVATAPLPYESIEALFNEHATPPHTATP